MKISESRRLDLRQMIAVTWPDFPLHQETLVPLQPQGWDYDSVSIGPWVLRAGRSQATRRHLQYEMAKLDTLNLPIPPQDTNGGPIGEEFTKDFRGPLHPHMKFNARTGSSL